ncbi:MAG TPA: helix-turn-helix domain-containing protein [Acidimicrobiales bacterium]|nr:helix-turn-helix domain-containing protein [Acidimicrobiales bacterium]
MSEGHEPVFPGFREMAKRRQGLATELVTRRRELGLSQTEVAARMGTSQSAVARLEAGLVAGDTDVRLSTLERYAAAVGRALDYKLEAPDRWT